MFKKKIFPLTPKALPLLVATILGAAPAWAEEPQAARALTPDTPIVTVNGIPYPIDVFKVFLNERLRQASGGEQQPDPAKLQEIAFNEFIDLIVAAQEAQSRKLDENPEVKAALALQRLAILRMAGMNTLAAELTPSEQEIKDAYNQFVTQADRTEYKARHILVDDENKAKELIKQLDKKKGKNFEELAKEHSLGPTKEKGGDLGWFDPRQMVPPFAEAIAALQPGAYTKEPVHTQFGWHVILLEDKRKAEPPAFEDAKQQIDISLRRKKVFEKLIELRNAAKIDLNEDVVRLKEKPKDGGETNPDKK